MYAESPKIPKNHDLESSRSRQPRGPRWIPGYPGTAKGLKRSFLAISSKLAAIGGRFGPPDLGGFWPKSMCTRPHTVAAWTHTKNLMKNIENEGILSFKIIKIGSRSFENGFHKDLKISLTKKVTKNCIQALP